MTQMAVAFHPPDTDLEIDVSHPGAGYLQVFAPGVTKGDPGDLSRRPYRLAGHVMYRCFQALTNAATSDDGGRHPVDGLLWMMTTVEALALLPTFQTAMLYAVADTDRAERVVDDPVLGLGRGE
jgi:hypothetical protein